MENKSDLKWQGPVITIVRFRRNGDLIYFRRNSIEVDLNDLRPENKIFDVIGFGGPLHVHLSKTKSHTRYLVDARTLVSLPRIRHAILQRALKTWANTDTRLGPNVFFMGKFGRQIGINESGGVLLRLSLSTWMCQMLWMTPLPGKFENRKI